MDIGMRHRRLKTGVSQGFHRAEPQTALHLLLATGLLHWSVRLLTNWFEQHTDRDRRPGGL